MRISRRTIMATAPALALAAAAALAGCGSGSTSPSQVPTGTAGTSQTSAGPLSGELTVFAAASLQEAFTELATHFTEHHPQVSITFDFQGSQDLVTALAEGSTADVLATASSSTMKKATEQHLVAASTEFATNVLTLIVPAGNPAGVTGLDSSLEGADLVVCAPAVPCGEATAKLATELGVSLNPVSEEQKVTDVRGKVESGEADVGIVYTTDAAGAADRVMTIALPSNSVVNHYPIAITKDSTNTGAAQAFVTFILSEEGQRILQDTYGFGAPGAE
ncbi:molybdate ABC transporter substrate-binding protein [Actinomyces faecalis]|uniref:molybdate ABC transporter substrate-binding protein n=1 Tax=Actinomyces faecalis TaxID=2722820 RepID=UPI0015531ECD|nr:molybdate ABC transporter substrate-binding protein [Actinomyces faecalis]